MSVVLKLENVWKDYRLGEIGYGTLRADLQTWWAKLRGREDPNAPVYNAETSGNGKKGIVHAIKDISLEVKEGEILGIIGANGAGKTTLLRLITGLTAPTKGKIKIKGRVGSLLAVGTGFHPDMTGRENVYLNGAVLGMTKAEVTKKFDEIVEFSGVERYIDTPVKRYSSGMTVRLGFAVAAHLEPEIMLIDEVLAVGDAEFRKKCVGKLDSASKGGRTVLFVSHNMGAINQLCPQTAWIDKGTIKSLNTTSEVVRAYMRHKDCSRGLPAVTFPVDPSKEAQLLSLRLLTEEGQMTNQFKCDQAIRLQMEFAVRRSLPDLNAHLEVVDPSGTLVMESFSWDTFSESLANLELGSYSVSVTIPRRSLAPGEYSVNLSLRASKSAHNKTPERREHACRFVLEDLYSPRGNRRRGYFSTLLPWSAPTSGLDCRTPGRYAADH